MSVFAVYAIALLLAVLGAAFLLVLVRQGRPRDVVGWVGVAMSVAVLCVSIALVILVRSVPERSVEVSLEAGAGSDERFRPRPEELNAEAPPLSFRLPGDGAEADLRDYRGRVVLLNFWATWCVPCIQELPLLTQLQNTYGPLGLTVLTISDEPPETIRGFTERLPIGATVGYLPEPTSIADPYRRALGVRPTTFVIDREGVLRAFELGAQPYAEFERLVVDYLHDNLAAR